MNINRAKYMTIITLLCSVLSFVPGCGGSAESIRESPPMAIASYGANAISTWDEVASIVIQMPAATTGTESERAPDYAFDLATLHVAMYDAAVAIARTYEPYAPTPLTEGAITPSMEAATNAAAYAVLQGLFPSRSSAYQPTYDSRVAAIPDGSAKARGLALGVDVAQGILALRANDGRLTPLATYVPGTAPGKFRGSNPIGRTSSMVKPFTLTTAAQFRAPGPPTLDSATYATDVNETKAYGGAMSTVRTAQQTEIARFHTEPPPRFWPRNLRQFASVSPNLVDNARLMAMLYVAHADATIGCFDSKYTYEFWRPTSAITLAAAAGNAAVVADPGWTPIVATPNHPEYPAGHSCASASVVTVLNHVLGAGRVSFKFDSAVPGTLVHTYATADALLAEIADARVYGGMHLRSATVDGAKLGTSVGNWVTENRFKPKKVASAAHASCESAFCLVAYLVRARATKT